MANTYTLTITADHRLIVNGVDVPPPEGIHTGDSETLLRWALDQVAQSHQRLGDELTLHLEDRRKDGYGSRQHVAESPLEDLTLPALRDQTGKDLSYVSEPYLAMDRAEEEARWGAREDQEDPPAAGDPVPEDAPVDPDVDSPDAGTHDDGTKDGTEEDQSPSEDEDVDETELALRPERERQDAIAQQRGWEPIERPVPRPAPAERVVKEPKKYNRRQMIIVGSAVLLVLAAAFGYRYYTETKVQYYAAVCVDERTMVRAESVRACTEPDSPAYNRWLYIAAGERVPAVGDQASQGNSFQKPDGPTDITYDFPKDGGRAG